MSYKTFNGWKQYGRVVCQGQRGYFRNEYGDYMYHVGQTKIRGGKTTVITQDYFGNTVRKVTTYY